MADDDIPMVMAADRYITAVMVAEADNLSAIIVAVTEFPVTYIDADCRPAAGTVTHRDAAALAALGPPHALSSALAAT